MYLIYVYPYDPAQGALIVDANTRFNMFLATWMEVETFARENCIHPYVILYAD